MLSQAYGLTKIHTFVKGSISVTIFSAADANVNKTDIKVILKICALLNKCKADINNTQIDNCQDINVVMSMYNLLKYSGNC